MVWTSSYAASIKLYHFSWFGVVGLCDAVRGPSDRDHFEALTGQAAIDHFPVLQGGLQVARSEQNCIAFHFKTEELAGNLNQEDLFVVIVGW